MDTSGTRSFCGFLAELGQRVPAVILPAMEPLLVHLSGEVSIALLLCGAL